MSAVAPGIQRPLVPGLHPEAHQPVYLRHLDRPSEHTATFAGFLYMLDLGLLDRHDSETAQEEPQADGQLPCGHEDIWLESGSCMACEPAYQTADDKAAYLDLMPDVYGSDPL